MARFYGSFGYTTYNGNGYIAHFQSLFFDEQEVPSEVDWQGVQDKYNNHVTQTSSENPFTDDPNGYYGDPNACSGFIEGTQEHNYCEY